LAWSLDERRVDGVVEEVAQKLRQLFGESVVEAGGKIDWSVAVS